MKSYSIVLILTVLYSIVSCGLTSEQLTKTLKQSKSKLLPINDENFENILNGKRDYHIVVFLTSESSQINCVLCHEIAPEFRIIADSWFKDHPNGIEINQEELEKNNDSSKNIYFFKSEFMESKKFFSLLQLNNIPKIFYFPPTKSNAANTFLKEKQEYQFFQGDHKSLMLNWIQDLTGHKLNLYIPINQTKLIVHILIGFFTMFFIKRYRSYVFIALQSKISWSIISLVTALLFTTGYMFNKIRGSPYVIEHQDGRTEYILPGQQNQLGIETQIMSFLYGILSVLVIVLIKRAPEIKNPSVSLILVVVVSALIFILFSLLLSIFGLKGIGFPYRFIRFF
ncbi:OST3 [Candida pseudojiufengensis]|uniref:OST3 n=1 Tax=Candida pseudojiufengensis TaxID=497109 RepID=UPI0022240CF6|nr:OST3 [Candida pseudojiufengensis]KAI5964219.1 OST3 [Candida pseudojiufengensis]